MFCFMGSFVLCAALAGCSSPNAKSKSGAMLKPSWDWSGIIGTGQSLSVGAHGQPILSTNQLYGNLKLSTGHLPWPVDPDDTNLALVPLVEPIGRLAHRYPSSWPENIDGETPHSAMANEITALVRADFDRDIVSVHSAVGEDGQGMVFIRKIAVQSGINGRSYEAAMIETKAITRLAKAAGKTFGVGAIIVTHGESDAGNRNYENELYQLWQDYNTDLPAITGQTQKIQMIVSQQDSCNDCSPSTLAQWKIGLDHPADIVCSGPKYQYPYFSDGVHLTADGYRQLGEKYGQIYFERVILGKDWQPLEPTRVERKGKTITVHFHVPVPPLVWETTFQPPHQLVDAWRQGRGFEISTTAGARVAITSAKISGDKVIIACATDPGPNARVGYATIADGPRARMTTPYPGTFRWGLLRDSDPFAGANTKKPQPNYCVAFEMTAP
jgi:lysophospholipase L1-like esterase